MLRLENGLDSYIPISATYLRSCFGMTLEQLVHSTTPVRFSSLPAYVNRNEILRDNGVSAEIQMVQAIQSAAASPAPVAMLLPPEVWRLVDALWSGHAMREKDLFALPGVPEEIIVIREALDCGTDFTHACSAHSYAATLQAFLKALPTPLLPQECFPVGVSAIMFLYDQLWMYQLVYSVCSIYNMLVTFLLSIFIFNFIYPCRVI